MDLYKLELEADGGNVGTRTFLETVEAEGEGEIRIAAMNKHTGTTLADYEYFRTFYRLFDHGETIQTEGVKFGRELVEKMSLLEREGMSTDEREAEVE